MNRFVFKNTTQQWIWLISEVPEVSAVLETVLILNGYDRSTFGRLMRRWLLMCPISLYLYPRAVSFYTDSRFGHVICLTSRIITNVLRAKIWKALAHWSCPSPAILRISLGLPHEEALPELPDGWWEKSVAETQMAASVNHQLASQLIQQVARTHEWHQLRPAEDSSIWAQPKFPDHRIVVIILFKPLSGMVIQWKLMDLASQWEQSCSTSIRAEVGSHENDFAYKLLIDINIKQEVRKYGSSHPSTDNYQRNE